MTDLTHLNAQGEAQMVDIAGKLATSRTAVAQAEVSMLPSIVSTLSQLPKGDALACARIAGIMAAKKTAELIKKLNDIDFYLRAAKAYVEECGAPRKGLELQDYAKQLLDKLNIEAIDNKKEDDSFEKIEPKLDADELIEQEELLV